jgi:bis(5'-nucleosyl)-tetraphosphatase (symmetrical)
MSGRRIFIGDIQGCLVELEELLDAVQFQAGIDELHPVGDLVNRGPLSLGVLRLLRELDAGGVLGNHDLHALMRARGEREAGGRDTLEGLFSAPERDELLEWLSERPLIRAWPDLLLVHAGVSPTWKDPVSTLGDLDSCSAQPELEFALGVRYCDADGLRPESDWPPPSAPFVPWYEHWQARKDEDRTVVFGHWARNGLVCEPRVRGLDTGCVWGKQLTAWIAEEDRVVQVNAREAYSPTSLPG